MYRLWTSFLHGTLLSGVLKKWKRMLFIYLNYIIIAVLVVKWICYNSDNEFNCKVIFNLYTLLWKNKIES